ncbi:hypothetical protein OJAV_G00111800 [Oryzias javanicus]|uniref:Uncharacterized protein n=1 Tax=Oryzias javanicus TaxID=123683 RepID=A0A437CW97_ORYJA|nr:hypothetical protein OJAV_G00111800 [Oryzias javanicus]
MAPGSSLPPRIPALHPTSTSSACPRGPLLRLLLLSSCLRILGAIQVPHTARQPLRTSSSTSCSSPSSFTLSKLSIHTPSTTTQSPLSAVALHALVTPVIPLQRSHSTAPCCAQKRRCGSTSSSPSSSGTFTYHRVVLSHSSASPTSAPIQPQERAPSWFRRL